MLQPFSMVLCSFTSPVFSGWVYADYAHLKWCAVNMKQSKIDACTQCQAIFPNLSLHQKWNKWRRCAVTEHRYWLHVFGYSDNNTFILSNMFISIAWRAVEFEERSLFLVQMFQSNQWFQFDWIGTLRQQTNKICLAWKRNVIKMIDTPDRQTYSTKVLT